MQIPSAPNTEHKCHHRSSSFSHLAAWQLAANMEQIQILETRFEDFSFYICKRRWRQGLSRWLIIQRWRHFPRPCWIYNQPALNWLSEDIWKLRWTSWENSIWSSKYFYHQYWYWQRCHVFRSLTLFLYQSCQSFSIEKHLISKSQTAVSWKVKRRPLYPAGRKLDWYWW